MNRTAIRNELINRVLSGHHLTGWLPGVDHKAAINEVRYRHGGGSIVVDGFDGMYQTLAKGVGAFERFDHDNSEQNAVVFVTWQDIIDTIARGCSPDRLAELDRAFTAWCDYHKARPSFVDDPLNKMKGIEREEEIARRFESWLAVEHPYDKARSAIIEAGFASEPVQEVLFG